MVNSLYKYKSTLILGVTLLVINTVGQFIYKRFDLTSDKRYTLSETAINITQSINSPLVIDIFLEGNLPPEIKKLQDETKQLLEEYKNINSNINYNFLNPLENENTEKDILLALAQEGITPITITRKEKGKQIQEVIIPWAIVSYNNLSVKVPLLNSKLGASTEENINNSVQQLEYVFTDAFYKVSVPKQKKIAVLKGNGELEDIYVADLLKTVREKYYLAPFTLDSVTEQPIKTLEQLKQFDMILVAKPTIPFSDEEKLVLDQFVINGGKSLWLVEPVSMEMDSLYKNEGQAVATQKDLNLNDFFFKYGIRLNPQLVKDVMCAPISLATGQRGNNTQYAQFPWLFSPISYPAIEHPIVNTIESIKFNFVSPIDTLANSIQKTILLQSSIYSTKVGLPKEIALSMVNERPAQSEFNAGALPFGVLLEGSFSSVFKNRVLPFEYDSFKNEGVPAKMIVISDGDIIKNQLDKQGAPLELGYDKWTNMTFGNKDFLLNSINYLLDNNGLINIRSKKVLLPILDQEKVYEQYTRTQILTLGLPLALLIVFGIAFYYVRNKKYKV